MLQPKQRWHQKQNQRTSKHEHVHLVVRVRVQVRSEQRPARAANEVGDVVPVEHRRRRRRRRRRPEYDGIEHPRRHETTASSLERGSFRAHGC